MYADVAEVSLEYSYDASNLCDRPRSLLFAIEFDRAEQLA